MPDVGLIDFALTPPLGSLQAVPDTRNPWTPGQHSIPQAYPGPVPVRDTFGIVLAGVTHPDGWGYTIGYADVSEGLDARRFYPPFAQVVAVHALLDGTPVFSQEKWMDGFITLMRWEVARPALMGLYIQPGWEVDIYWLRGL